jgi:uncharacterized protein
MEAVVLDTNVVVAALFNPKSASARILQGIRDGRFRLIWNQPTRRETEMIVRRIPPLDFRRISDLFRPEGECRGPVGPTAFTVIPDPDDRKFAALSAAANVPLITNDNLILAQRGRIGLKIVTPSDFLARQREEEVSVGGSP